jgi:aspartyl-tRNA(Asn)/glutamyl-tRNA(Gln) amidotransferase subunit A
MKDFEITSLSTLRAMITSRKISAKEVCLHHLSKIESQNHDLGIMTDVLAETALKEAASVDRRIVAGESVGRLAGIPMIIKDNIDTYPAICAAGLSNLDSHRPPKDAQIVEQLRGEGAVILGVAATDSGAFGVVSPTVKNPNFPLKIAGGSSGGSAAAVAAGFCVAAIGTDTGGSIRIPAACCGIVGLKPTFGLVPSTGVRPLSKSFDHVGPLARRVADVRAIMSLFTNTTSTEENARQRLLEIGIPEDYFSDACPEAKQVVTDVAKCCEELGHHLRKVSIPAPDEIIPTHLVLSLTEAARFYADTSANMQATFPDAAKDGIELGKTYSSQDYLRALEHRAELIARIENVFTSVDFLLTPTLPILPPAVGMTEIAVGGQLMNILHAMIRYVAAFDQSGHPALALPWPVPKSACMGSVQIVGRHGSDEELLGLGELIESVRDAQ